MVYLLVNFIMINMINAIIFAYNKQWNVHKKKIVEWKFEPATSRKMGI